MGVRHLRFLAELLERAAGLPSAVCFVLESDELVVSADSAWPVEGLKSARSGGVAANESATAKAAPERRPSGAAIRRRPRRTARCNSVLPA